MDTNALIDAVRAYPSLYAKDNSSTNIEQKNMIWNQIALKVNQPVEKCKAKWRNLRDSYQKAVKWKRELEQLGKPNSYHEYKHERSLQFLEIGPKRGASRDSNEPSKLSKRQKVEHHETVAYSVDNQDEYTQAVEYLIETESQQDEDEEQEELSINTISQEYVVHDLRDEEKIGDICAAKDDCEELSEQTFLNYGTITAPSHETVSSQPDDAPYQESYVNESQNESSMQLDSWLSGIKETILSLPKLLRARAKKQINDLVSDFEIKYLESIDVDRR